MFKIGQKIFYIFDNQSLIQKTKSMCA